MEKRQLPHLLSVSIIHAVQLIQDISLDQEKQKFNFFGLITNLLVEVNPS